MNHFRRQWLHLSLAGAACAVALTPLQAADYPQKPIQIVVPFGAGDALDASARLIADRMKDALGVPVIVKNIPGAGGGKGTAEAAKATPDGYTLLMGSTGALTARPLISDSGYRTDDFTPIAQLVEAPIALAVPTDSPYKSLKELFEAASKSAGSIKYATPGPGATQHINMERFAERQGVQLTHIGGGGGKGAVTKALSGEVDFAFVGASNYTSLVKGGKLRVLGVAAPERLSYLPDAPTFREQGYDFDTAVWFGLLTNKGAPQPAIDKLASTLASIAKADETQALYTKLNLHDAYLDQQAFGERIAQDVQENGRVLKQIGLVK